MNCKNVQELLLTDYFDDQLDPTKKKLIKEHIQGCIHCQKFAQEVQETIPEFSIIPDVSLPQKDIWNTIKSNIEEETLPKFDFLQNLKEIFQPKPAFVFGALTILLFSAVYFRSPGYQARNISEEISDELVYLSEYESPQEDDNGYDTDIEQYFL